MLKRGLLISVVVMMVVFMSVGSVSADYAGDIQTIFGDVIYEMEDFVGDINGFVNESISLSTFMNRIDRKKGNALGNLKSIIRASDNVLNEEIHAEAVGIISNWYLTLELVDKGLKNGDMDTVDAGTKVMGHIGEKAAQLTTRIENNY
jgi:hypothetical protein